ncbi:ribosomal oxygenase [Moraxella caviae]|uniref:Cupin superfamily protein n=1 Tax=Moraxella caviae TaxID=34060 RepID=A0A1S9ZUS3_9GAMM|nr:cupin domain-containing protein [Moraxella caviae]OOR87143.1 ribosomal oxygenase [Moraxella caviae]STZ14778.1 Cupin superfamily protein [Moraxella caviae]
MTNQTTERLAFCLPNGMSAEEFLRDYWQKKPLLIKNGLPAIAQMFEPEDVLGLACEEGVSARLISQDDTNPNTWSLKNSPLDESDIQNAPQLWTVLVQNLEQWSPELGQLWQAFDFIPKWQQDDIMVSYAPVGGSVGAHYDEYDVFLAQGFGERRWQLGKMCDGDTPFVAGQPIRLLDDMGELIFDEILEPGDVLYVPPRLSHHGIAQNDCLTFSFGFRRPNVVQILDEIADVATHERSLFSPITLPQALQTDANELSAASLDAIKQVLIDTLNSPAGDDIVRSAVAELVSKRQYDLLAFEDEMDAGALAQRLGEGECLMANPASRFVRCDGAWYINGECVSLDDESTALLTRLVNGEVLTLDDLPQARLSELAEWMNDYWLVLI